MATSMQLYTGEYGHTLTARTYCNDIANASLIRLVFKRDSDDTTAALTAAAVEGDTTYYAVQAQITETDWLAAKAGEWTGQVEATFAAGKFYGDVFDLHVEATPAV